MPQVSNVTEIRRRDVERAVVFVHGFNGNRNDTWDRFPSLLGAEVGDWDIYTLGYATTLLPDLVGIWAADPELPILATKLSTELGLTPFDRYQSLALVAHSMGGLVVQKALVDDPVLAQRVRHVMLFGTPSGGLRKASWVQFWKRQLRNMAAENPFITDLRQQWDERYKPQAPFELLVVAGERDQFVPPESSLGAFDPRCVRVVSGDHLSMVKPEAGNAASVLLVAAALRARPSADAAAQVSVAAETATGDAIHLVDALETRPQPMNVKEVVDSALALERAGQRDESIALLKRHQDLGTDVQGTLAGRLKRQWFESDDPALARRARDLYQIALDQALANDDHEQIYYLAINVAFLDRVAFNQAAKAQATADLAAKHALLATQDYWSTATRAEAHLYHDRPQEALALYKEALRFGPPSWQILSTGLHATRLALMLGNDDLVEQLEMLFAPGVRRVNKIFVTYSHADKAWLDRLQTMTKPYLRNAEVEIDLWDDTRLKPGDRWEEKIQDALREAGVAVALVSADFLASPYVNDKELPLIVRAAEDGDLRLLWIYLSPAGWEETPLEKFQATHDTRKPLVALPPYEADEILKSVARSIKEAALGATGRFTGAHEVTC